MTAARLDHAERLRRCRLAFERALRDGTSVVAAARADVRERWAAADLRLAERRRIAASAVAERPAQWWQRD